MAFVIWIKWIKVIKFVAFIINYDWDLITVDQYWHQKEISCCPRTVLLPFFVTFHSLLSRWTIFTLQFESRLFSVFHKLYQFHLYVKFYETHIKSYILLNSVVYIYKVKFRKFQPECAELHKWQASYIIFQISWFPVWWNSTNISYWWWRFNNFQSIF